MEIAIRHNTVGNHHRCNDLFHAKFLSFSWKCAGAGSHKYPLVKLSYNIFCHTLYMPSQ